MCVRVFVLRLSPVSPSASMRSGKTEAKNQMHVSRVSANEIDWNDDDLSGSGASVFAAISRICV